MNEAFKKLIDARRNLATPKQREYMDEQEIPYTETTSKEEASLFISQHVDDMNECAAGYYTERQGYEWK